MEENTNSGKIELMFGLLSKERQGEIQRAIYNTILELTKNMKPEESESLHGKVIELTIAFDKEYPYQYVYFIGQLVKIENNLIPETLKKLMPTALMQFVMKDIEVYKQDNIDSWLDYKKKLEKQQSVYYENQNTGEKRVEGQDVKQEEQNSAIDPKDITNDEMYEYYNEYVQKYSVDEYLDKFYFASRSLINNVFESKLYQRHWGNDYSLKQNFRLVTALQNFFSAVDFTEFSKSELEMLGFINYKDKCMLIPIWAYPIALRNHTGLEIETVTGKNIIIGMDINSTDKKNYDARVGVVGFGIKLSSLRQDSE
jgi:hypothetical protein